MFLGEGMKSIVTPLRAGTALGLVPVWKLSNGLRLASQEDRRYRYISKITQKKRARPQRSVFFAMILLQWEREGGQDLR